MVNLSDREPLRLYVTATPRRRSLDLYLREMGYRERELMKRMLRLRAVMDRGHKGEGEKDAA